jgi:hypothetical protein
VLPDKDKVEEAPEKENKVELVVSENTGPFLIWRWRRIRRCTRQQVFCFLAIQAPTTL